MNFGPSRADESVSLFDCVSKGLMWLGWDFKLFGEIIDWVFFVNILPHFDIP